MAGGSIVTTILVRRWQIAWARRAHPAGGGMLISREPRSLVSDKEQTIAEMMRYPVLWHGTHPQVLIQAFRGAAKSTLAEEAILIQALLRSFHNAIILGETYERAVERLRAIKHEIENKDSVISPEAIEKTKTWLLATVLPALEPGALIRINGTPLHPRSVICQLAADSGWTTRAYPILYKDDAGAECSIWPERFPLAEIARKRADYARLGMAHSFAQEYLCQAEDPSSKPFTDALIRVEPVVRTWHAVYAMCDPARSVRSTSATTGMAVWSWIANRLVV